MPDAMIAKFNIDEYDKYLRIFAVKLEQMQNESGELFWFSDSPENGAQSSEEERIEIFKDALAQRRGLSEVSEELRNRGLRDIYPRNPAEFILYFCLASNDHPKAAVKYGAEDFKRLVRKLSAAGTVNPAENSQNERSMTLGELRRLVLSMSELHETEGREPMARTAAVTLTIKNDLRSIDLSSEDAEAQLAVLYSRYYEKMNREAASLRYYLAKYIYCFAVGQIREYKTILSRFVAMGAEKAFEYLTEQPEAPFDPWSLAESAASLCRQNSKYTAGEKLLPSECAEILLSALHGKSSNMIFFGKPLAATSGFFMSGKNGTGEPLSFSDMKDKTQIFSDGMAGRVELAKLTVSDFDGFKLDYSKIYRHLFKWQEPFGEAAGDELSDRDGGAYIAGLLSGRYDISRSAMLMALAACKGADVFRGARLKAPDVLADGAAPLALERVDEILNRVGYADISDNYSDDISAAFDSFYYEIFDSEAGDMSVFASLGQSLDDLRLNGSGLYLPFEMTVISNKQAHRRLVK